MFQTHYSNTTQFAEPTPVFVTSIPQTSCPENVSHKVILPWLATISPTVSAIEDLTVDNKIPTKDSIEFYHLTDDIVQISQDFTHNGEVYNLVPYAFDLLKLL